MRIAIDPQVIAAPSPSQLPRIEGFQMSSWGGQALILWRFHISVNLKLTSRS